MSKKTLWKFNRLLGIANLAKQFNFYIRRKSCYLAFLWLNRNNEKWPHTREIEIVGRNHILPRLGIESTLIMKSYYQSKSNASQHRGKTSAHASTLLKSVLRTYCQVFRILSKTQNGSDVDVLPFIWKCKRNNERGNLKTKNQNYSLHMQEVVLCEKINQRWLSINLLYKTFFN